MLTLYQPASAADAVLAGGALLALVLGRTGGARLVAGAAPGTDWPRAG